MKLALARLAILYKKIKNEEKTHNDKHISFT